MRSLQDGHRRLILALALLLPLEPLLGCTANPAQREVTVESDHVELRFVDTQHRPHEPPPWTPAPRVAALDDRCAALLRERPRPPAPTPEECERSKCDLETIASYARPYVECMLQATADDGPVGPWGPQHIYPEFGPRGVSATIEVYRSVSDRERADHYEFMQFDALAGRLREHGRALGYERTPRWYPQ